MEGRGTYPMKIICEYLYELGDFFGLNCVQRWRCYFGQGWGLVCLMDDGRKRETLHSRR